MFKKEIGWGFVERTFQIVSTIIVMLIMARYIAPEDYGQYVAAGAMVAIVIPFLSFNYDLFIIREEDSTKITNEFFTLFSVIFSVNLLALLLSFFLNKESMFLSLSIAGLLQIFSGLFSIKHRLNNQLDVVSKINMKILSITLLCKIICLVYYGSLISYVLFLALDSLLLIILLPDKISPKIVKPFLVLKHLKEMMTLSANTFAILLGSRVDVLLISYLLGDASVAAYSYGVKPLEMLYFLPALLINIYYPKIFKSEFDSFIDKSFLMWSRIFVFATSVGIVVLSFYGEIIFRFLFTDLYAQSWKLLVIYALNLPLVFWGMHTSRFLFSIGRTDIILKRSVVMLALNVILSIFLTKLYGLSGPAWATVITAFIVAFISDYFFTETRIHFQLKIKTFSWIKRS